MQGFLIGLLCGLTGGILCVFVCVVRLSFTACFLSQLGALPEVALFSVGP